MKPNLKLIKLKVSSQQRIAERINPESLVQSFVLARYRAILDQREEILTAFVAKYQCQPDEAVQVVERINNETEVFYAIHKSRYKPKRDKLIREEFKRLLSEDE